MAAHLRISCILILILLILLRQAKMPNRAELEIGIYPYFGSDPSTVSIELRYNDPDDQATRSPVRGLANINLAELRRLRLDTDASGRLLTASLFHAPELIAYFEQARAAVQTDGAPLRLRLFIDPALASLQDIPWELLRDPGDGSWLLADENLPFSRYLSSNSWERVSLKARKELRALIFIANPPDLADGSYHVDGRPLAPIDVAKELERAQIALDGIEVQVLASNPESPGLATLENLLTYLRDGYDILYLVAHGALLSQEPPGPYLWLEAPNVDGETGPAAVTSGTILVDRIKDLVPGLRPRLAVLASCQSAGQAGMERLSDAQGAMAALGPRLAQAGIPAVLAMQGDATIETVSRFMPGFFRELVRDGQIDRAVAAARSLISDRPDAWMPVLFLRLRAGRIWYQPGLSIDRNGSGEVADKWRSIIRFIENGRCTPILGPALFENLIGSPRDIAMRWAEIYRYPLEPHERESLPQVAQFLSVNQYDDAPIHELEEYLSRQLRERFAKKLPEELLLESVPLDRVMESTGIFLQHEDPMEPHRILAQLPLSLFITTNGNNLMTSALKDAGKDPQVLLCPWNEHVARLPSIYNSEPDYEPSVERPLVYHLFGRLNDPQSFVLKEDDYFDFLIGVTRNQSLIPARVRSALAATSLLFLGFQIDDWQFRVLFRSILAQEGGDQRKRIPHIAAQIQPDENRILEPERARRYLEKYYGQDANISLYWGSVEDFIKEFWPQWLTRPQKA